MSLSDFRQGVQDELQADLGITMVAGVREGRSEDRDIGYVWVDRIAEDGTDVNLEVISLTVRVFKQWKIQEGTHRPVEAFEALIEAVQLSLKDKQTQLGPWFFRVTEILPDYEDMYITATVEARQDNAFAA